MLTLSLLHPIKQVPVQVWTFGNESTVRIGRSTDNQVILYSAVVSRHHVELRRVGNAWEIVNLGTNGTYLDGKRITQVPVKDGAIIRLARSGPNIQIRIGAEALKDVTRAMEDEMTLNQRPDYPITSTEITDRSAVDPDELDETKPKDEQGSNQPTGTIPVPPHLRLPPDSVQSPATAIQAEPDTPEAVVVIESAPRVSSTPLYLPIHCTHPRGDGLLFCPDCGQPMQVIQTIGEYQLVKVLGQGDICVTYLGWQQGRSFSIKTLNSLWLNHPKAVEALECESETLRQINHPCIPHWVDFFSADQPYLVMEMIQGSNLAQWITTHGPIPLPLAIIWIIEICNILQYLHNFTPPILHRGIKPTSLIRQATAELNHRIALIEFGTIKALVLGEKVPPGSSGYNAPEQLEVDATLAVDIYPLGPLLAYLITGQNPIAFFSDRGQGYQFYPDSVPGVSAELAAVMQTMSHPDPHQRYSSTQALVAALQEFKSAT